MDSDMIGEKDLFVSVHDLSNAFVKAQRQVQKLKKNDTTKELSEVTHLDQSLEECALLISKLKRQLMAIYQRDL